jgi:ribonuclease T2
MQRILDGIRVRWATGVTFGAAIVLAVLAGEARAQVREWNEPGQFDFYVLALSWSPSFCEESAERSPFRSGTDPQCGERRYSFVVHGLWPQYERGFPEFCQVPAPRLGRAIVSSMLDLMPSPRLIFHEWDAHGTCSGLSAPAFFEKVRKAYAQLKIPAQYLELTAPLIVTPDEVQDAFVKSNPGLTRAGISISCNSRRLNEVRICLGKDLQFRECSEIARRACRRDTLVMPPARGG